MSRGALLTVQNLSVAYQVGGRWLRAVHEAALTLPYGQIHGVVGESGSGKSTLALALLGALSANGRIEAGSQVLFQGQDLTRLTRAGWRRLWAKDLKLVPQNPASALNPSQRVGAQILESLRQGQRLDGQAARTAMLEMFQRVHFADPADIARRYPHQLSGGQQQRVMIAMALLSRPALLVMDEPTTGLDVTTEAAILDLVRELTQDRQTAVLYITHNFGVVAQLCDSLTVMYGGEVMVEGKVSDIFARPLHPYTAGLLRSLPRFGQTKYDAPLLTIEGYPPALGAGRRACVFAERCYTALERCRAEKPALEMTPDGRWVRCHRWREIYEGTLAPPRPAEGEGLSRRVDNQPLLRLDELAKHFPAARRWRDLLRGRRPPPLRAVDGVNLAIQRGRTLGLVGESGSGKTTLSRLIVGLTDATSGNIHLAGADLPIGSRRPRQTLARLQLVFQNPHNALNPYLTIGQALSRPLIRLRGLSQREAKAEVGRLLEAVNLPPSYAARYPSELSGGEKQRVGIARAFAAAPDLVVCDEPVSALDVSVQSAILNLLAALQDENGTAYLFVSHDLAVVGYLADYVAVMYGGQIMEVGYARDVFAPPWHPYTEALIAAIPKPDPSQKTPPLLLTEGEALPVRGCRFAGRCPRRLGAVCEQEAPPWQDEGDAHFIRCHIPLSELRAAQSHAQKEPKG